VGDGLKSNESAAFVVRRRVGHRTLRARWTFKQLV
jgi:hypothetical protein